MKKAILSFVILLMSYNSFSQEKLLDYFVDKKGDTIYGIIRANSMISPLDWAKSTPKASNYKFSLIEENKDPTQKKIYTVHNLKKVNSFSYKGKLFKFEKKQSYNDGVYYSDKEDEIDTSLVYTQYADFICKERKLKDYTLTKSADTIYGNIYDPLFGKPYIEFENKKIKIDKSEITAYRYKNQVFRFLQKPRTEIFDNKEDFIRLLIDDKVKLYDDILNKNTSTFTNQNYTSYEREFISNRFFFIEKNGELIYVNPIKFSIKAREIFSDCPEIMKKISKNYFVYEDLYSMVILYNYYLKHQ